MSELARSPTLSQHPALSPPHQKTHTPPAIPPATRLLAMLLQDRVRAWRDSASGAVGGGVQGASPAAAAAAEVDAPALADSLAVAVAMLRI